MAWLYPLVERVVGRALGIGFGEAGLITRLACAPLAAWGIYRLVRSFTDHRTAFTTVALWGTLPVAVVQTMAYTESLFTAMAAWSLDSARRGRWALAGGLAGTAGLTRPMGCAVVAALAVAVLVHLHSLLGKPAAPSPTGLLRRPLLALLVAAAGAFGYPGWVASQTGHLDGYLLVTSGWGNSFDGGATFTRWMLAQFHIGNLASGTALVVAVAAALLLFVLMLRGGVPAPLVTYAAVLLVLAFGMSGYFGSRPRYLLPAFVLLVPIAGWLGQRPRWRAVVLTASTVVSWLYGTAWLLGPGPP